MKQPELGKKILELRLAKGLTQSELAEKCNVGLRTIQRIESAEVTPRSYTLKLIFTSLNYEVFSPAGDSLFRTKRIVYKLKISIRDLATSFLSLFNLKTHKFKKLAVVSVPCISIIFFFSLTGFKKNQELGKYSIDELNHKFVDWFNSGQIDSVGLIYQKDACFIPYKHSEIHGREDIETYYRSLYRSGFRLYKNASKAMIIAGPITVERGVWHANNKSDFTGTYLTQWRLSPKGTWCIENSMSNDDNIN